MENNKKAIALFSGGLDSILAVKWMEKLGFTVYPVFFETSYLPPERAILSAATNDIQLTLRDISADHLKLLKDPVYGFGKNLNPCIDCHGLMFKAAGEMLAEFEAAFLISGEVLGQRPMSQRKIAMQQVAKLSGFADIIIRPLSQQLLPDTLPIREGWVKKADLLDLSGRKRDRQIKLAIDFGITDYPAPAGGCLLTDISFSLRLKDLLEYKADSPRNLKLIRFGRHFRLDENCKLIIGRNQADNQRVMEYTTDGIRLNAAQITGPLGFIDCEKPSEETLNLALGIFWFYHRKAESRGLVRLDTDSSMRILEAAKSELATINKHHISQEKYYD